ncbi:DNA-binding transcription repressor [Saccharomycopsis crataegensis]|uniref:DNA-binding transcription repressor n=1 Tax=Saccharomycopsis crataegensis TaxID=43959 RepID=A0AAV5QY34_9ASCO|nr:DNA-binding transcription repressor [Saccharomycopsis crataegensis]
MSCYLPTSSIRTSSDGIINVPTSSTPSSTAIKFEAPNGVSHKQIASNLSKSSEDSCASRKRKFRYPDLYKNGPDSVATNSNRLDPSKRPKISYPPITTTTTGANPGNIIATHSSSSWTPPSPTTQSNYLSNKSSTSSLTSSVIRDCSLNYLDTLPTNVNKLPGTEDPWDISDSSDSDFAIGHNHNYKIQSGSTDNTSLAASYGATTTDSQEMESFYINWRKNFEKWLFIKNPEKYGEFKNFLKFNSNTATSNSFGGSDVSDFESSPSSSPRRHANFNHPSNITFGGNPFHKRSYSSGATESSSIKDKINQYLVHKPVFNSRISRKFKNKSTEIMLHKITKKRSFTGLPASNNSISTLIRAANQLSSSPGTIVSQKVPVTKQYITDDVKLSPILSISKNSHSKSNGQPKKIRLPSIDEIFDPQSAVSSSGSTTTINNQLVNGAQDRRSISTSSVESTNSVFSDNGSINSFMEEEYIPNDTTAAKSALSPPLIAFKSDFPNPQNINSAYYKPQSVKHSSTSPYNYVTSPSAANSSFGHQVMPQIVKKPSPKKPSPVQNKVTGSPSPKKPKSSHHCKRTCVSCGSSQSPCWRPSWSSSSGQLCNSCGLRYKKTNARCLNNKCLRIPAKGEFNLIKNKAAGKVEDYKCLRCGSEVEVK